MILLASPLGFVVVASGADNDCLTRYGASSQTIYNPVVGGNDDVSGAYSERRGRRRTGAKTVGASARIDVVVLVRLDEEHRYS